MFRRDRIDKNESRRTIRDEGFKKIELETISLPNAG
jgi:hypothetical protein